MKIENRQICCWKTDTRPLYECRHILIHYESYTTLHAKHTYEVHEKCGNLMHTDCIEKYGKCHKDAGVKEWQSSAR